MSNELTELSQRFVSASIGVWEGAKDKAAIPEMSLAIARSTHTHTHSFRKRVCLAANVIAVLTALVNSFAQNELSGSVGSLL